MTEVYTLAERKEAIASLRHVARGLDSPHRYDDETQSDAARRHELETVTLVRREARVLLAILDGCARTITGLDAANSMLTELLDLAPDFDGLDG